LPTILAVVPVAKFNVDAVPKTPPLYWIVNALAVETAYPLLKILVAYRAPPMPTPPEITTAPVVVDVEVAVPLTKKYVSTVPVP
jgi:hypothetical protein